ncbi:cyclic nucleotide-binding domain-containing protein 2 [Nematostella vectensis]|uniref:cyclic nucleotide-binding domain-containing protein 2 n=1 Tax=Nematostella vectensis TaxID=45351 RepID=UPI00138FA5F0|nr:cyclic nucleotide-binding domain-containing protein 2 [Nematostella vectensis]
MLRVASLSKHANTDAKPENEKASLDKKRRGRMASLPTSSLFGSHGRDEKALKNTYTSQAVKEYRQRRALHHRRLRHGHDKDKGTTDNEPEKLKPLEQFRRIVRLVIVLRRAFTNIVLYAREKGNYEQVNSETTLSLKSTAGAKAVDNLLFDPALYKCSYQITLPNWARLLTSKPPSLRTDAEIKMLVRLTRQLKGFRKYSPQIQFALCRALRYDSFARSRVVIRKGHVAQRFYFIYSGSVCVTFDDDEYSAFVKPTENTVLHRGDFFGELAFLRNIPRSATIVCLEPTELLSIDKVDFFTAKIDKSFKRDMERRVDFLSNHPLFSSWPIPVVRELAEVSRIHEYCTEEVIVRDSTNSSWLVMVIKGECDIVRLVDLSSCSEYVSHCSKHQPIGESDPRQATPLHAPTPRLDMSRSGIGQSRSEMGLHTSKQPQKQTKTRTKSAVKFMGETHKAPVIKGSVITPGRAHVTHTGSDVDQGLGVGVFMVLDRLRTGSCFGGWSVIQQEELKNRRNRLYSAKQRRVTLLSRGCEVVKVSKEGFIKYADAETYKTLRQMARDYPSDNKLCHTYLKHSDWRTYREGLVENLVLGKMSRQDAAKGVWRTFNTCVSPVPPPLCSLKPWHPAQAAWGRGQRRTAMTSRMMSSRIEESLVVEDTHLTPQSLTGKTSPCSTPPQRASSRATPIEGNHPSRPPSTAPRFPPPRNVLPQAHNELVLAQGSHRALVLTQGGARINEVQREVEKRIVGMQHPATCDSVCVG